MANSPKLKVLIALTQFLEQLDTTPGNTINLAGKVFRGRTVYGAEKIVPFVGLLEDPRPDFPLVTGNSVAKAETWLLHLQAWVKDNVDHPTDEAYEIGYEIEKHMRRLIDLDNEGRPTDDTNYYLGMKKLIADINFGPGVARPPVENVSPRGFFYLPIRIKLAYDVGA